MATNSNVPTAEPGVFGPRRRGNASSRSPRLVDAQELWDIDDVASYLGVTKQTIYSWRTTGYGPAGFRVRSEEHTSELQSLMRISYAVFCLKKKIINQQH